MIRAAREMCLAIDLGTGGPTVGLVTLEGVVLDQEWHAVSTSYGDYGAATQDPRQWWQLIIESAQRLLQKHPGAASEVVAVAVTGQWASTVPVDAQGEPVGPCVMWFDTRGGPHARRLVGGRVQGYRPVAIAKWVQRTGGAPSTSGDDPIGHLLYLVNDEPEQLSQTKWFLEPVDYLTMRFTGRASASHASMQGAWLTDNRRLDLMEYDEELVELLGLPMDKLPPLVPIGSVVGSVQNSVAELLGLGSSVAVITGLPDLQAAAIGAGATAPYATHLALSTTSWISCPVPKKHTDAFHSIATVPGLTNDTYLLVNNQDTGARALEWLRGVLAGPRELSSYEELSALAATARPGSGGVIFTPWLAGERSPVNDRHARGGFANMSLATGTAELVRAVMEGVAYNSRWLLTYVERFTKQTLTPIRLVGGGANSALWCQIYADVLNRPMQQVPDPTFAQMRGMAVLAGVTLGRRTLPETDALLPSPQTFEPNESRAEMYATLAEQVPEFYAENKKRWRTIGALK